VEHWALDPVLDARSGSSWVLSMRAIHHPVLAHDLSVLVEGKIVALGIRL